MTAAPHRLSHGCGQAAGPQRIPYPLTAGGLEEISVNEAFDAALAHGGKDNGAPGSSVIRCY
jgi:hypothetical protein